MQLIPLIQSGPPTAPRNTAPAGAVPDVSFAVTFDQLVASRDTETLVAAQDMPAADAQTDDPRNVEGAAPELTAQDGDELAALAPISARPEMSVRPPVPARLVASVQDVPATPRDAPSENKKNALKRPHSGAESFVTFAARFESATHSVVETGSTTAAMPTLTVAQAPSAEGRAVPDPLLVVAFDAQHVVQAPQGTPQATKPVSNDMPLSALKPFTEPNIAAPDGDLPKSATAPRGAPAVQMETPDLPAIKPGHPAAALHGTLAPTPTAMPMPKPKPTVMPMPTPTRSAAAPDMPSRFEVSAPSEGAPQIRQGDHQKLVPASKQPPLAATQPPAPIQITAPLAPTTPVVAMQKPDNPAHPVQQTASLVTVRMVTAPAPPTGSLPLNTQTKADPEPKLPQDLADTSNTQPPPARPVTLPQTRQGDRQILETVMKQPAIAAAQRPVTIQTVKPIGQATTVTTAQYTVLPMPQPTPLGTVQLVTGPGQPVDAIPPNTQAKAIPEQVLPQDPVDAPVIRQTATHPAPAQPTLPPPVTAGARAPVSQPVTEPIPVDAAPDAILTDIRAPGAPSLQVHSVTTTPAPQHQHATLARQIAETAVQTGADRQIELTLNPAELGRVRMSLSTTDTGASVIIHADRPETLDLMRRNIGELESEFADMGYGDVDFAFSGGDGAQDQRDDRSPHNTPPVVDGATDASGPHGDTPLSPDSAMDIRV